MIGRRVRSFWGDLGVVVRWEPLTAAMTDALVLFEEDKHSRGVWEKFACACGGVWAVKLDRPSSQGGHPINGAIPWPACPANKSWPTGRSW